MRFRFGILVVLLSQQLMFVYATPLEPAAASRLSGRLRAYVDQQRRDDKSEAALKGGFPNELAVAAHLLSFVAVEPVTVRSATRARHAFIIEWAKTAVGKSKSEPAPLLRRQIRSRVWSLLNRYSARGETQRNLYDILEVLGLWRAEDLPVLGRLAGHPDQFAPEYASVAFGLIQSHPERIPDLVDAIRAGRGVSDDQRALLVLSEQASSRDVYALLWSRFNAYARSPELYDLRSYDDSDLIQLALVRLMNLYVADDEVVYKGFQRAWTEAGADKASALDIRQRRSEALRLFAQGELFHPIVADSVRVNEVPPVAKAPRAPRRVRSEGNVLYLDFGCAGDFVAAD